VPTAHERRGSPPAVRSVHAGRGSAPAVPAFARTLAALAAFGALLGLGASVSLPGCGTDATGVEACRDIETARCKAAAACGYTADQVTVCTEFYRDQCLHGLENSGYEPSASEVEACVAAVNQVRACAEGGKATMTDCPEAALVPGADASVTPCAILTDKAHLLAACAFASAPPDAGTPADGGDGSGGAGGAGGAGGGTTTTSTTAGTGGAGGSGGS
jgi:hypothetical protein